MGKEKDKKPLFGGIFQKFFKPSAKAEAKKKKEHHLTVQRSIPYLEMGRDGICRVEEHLYSKTIRFYDINYQLAQNEDKNTIFESWCDFLNYFDSSIRFQLSFINHKSDMSEYNKVIQIEPQHDQFDDVRMEYAQMLKQQLAKGNNGLVRTKYITFSIEAKSVKEAKPRLERIETDTLNNFKVLGVKAYPLNGVERLQIMYEMFHQEEERKFEFSYDRILQSGMTTKDFIAPTSFLFKNGKDFQMGDTIGAVSYLNILAPELTDKVLAEFLDMDKNLVVSIHVQSVDQLKAIKLIKGKITDLDRMKIEEQKKAVRSGYDMEIIPSDLATYGGEAKKILDDLQSRNERMFLVTVLFLNTAKTKQELDSAVFQTAGIAQKFNCTLNRLDYMQEQGLMSSLPLANNLVPIKRALTTTSTAIFVPFTTQELFMEGDSLYYGLNAVSNNMIMADRKQLKNPNGLILGTPGSGKSFSAKREMTNVFFTTTDDIIIADPEGEYYPLVEALGGQVIHISSTSRDYINPMDIKGRILIPFNNLINDTYCRDISLRVRSHLDVKRKEGQFIGSFAGYGYRKDPKDKNHLIIDEYAAGIVQEIFKQKLNGMSSQRIASHLNELGVLPPNEYMMQDIRTGKIQCIVVKDLSRFGRDYIETGSYLETIFPMLHVRFIAINDDFDNIRQSDVDSLAVPIKNMVNSLYAKDISKKISLSYQMRREKGIPTSWCTPYGYQLNQQGNKFEATEDAKWVKLIYQWYLAGVSTNEIARRLEFLEVARPNERLNRKLHEGDDPTYNKWHPSTVLRILNSSAYIGELVSGKTQTASYKGIGLHPVEKKEWHIVENAHEAIILKSDFEKVQARREQNKEKRERAMARSKATREKCYNHLSGMVYCDCCRRNMTFERRVHGTVKETHYGVFICKRKKNTTPCAYHAVPEKMLMMVAMDQIHHLVSTMCEEEKLVKDMMRGSNLDSARSIKMKENSILFRIQEAEERRLRLYEDYKAEILDEDEYSQLKEHYIAEKQRLEHELQKQRQRALELEKRIKICDAQMERMRGILNQNEFDEELVHELIKKIYVGMDNSVEVEFKCSDPYQEVLAIMSEVQNE